MNKSQLIDAIAHKSSLTKVQSGDAVNAFIDAVTAALRAEDTVTLIGFGSFSTAKRAARVGRNPKTGKVIKIAATTRPKFKAGKALKEAVASPLKKKK